MKLLIITQKVDKKDPILGFFHGWIAEFAKHAEQVTVITQVAGEYSLPMNVNVVSLGKEKGVSRIGQILRFWSLQWKLRKNYNTVFVHMTPIWIVLGSLLWKFTRKPMYLWYEARGGGFALPLSLHLVKKVFGATEYGLPHPSSKHIVVGHGIDADEFVQGVWARDTNLIVTVGRITRTKRLDIVLNAFSALPPSSKLIIAGGVITNTDGELWVKLARQIEDLHLTNRVEVRWVPRTEIPELLGKAGLLLHACEGGLDKIVLEAMSCGCPIVSCSVAARAVLPDECIADQASMSAKAKALLALTPAEQTALGARLRDKVTLNHSLPTLIRNISSAMK